MTPPKLGFHLKLITLSLDSVVPIREIRNPRETVARYGTMVSSIKEVGIIEPLVVYPHKTKPGKYSLMDGHLRYEAVKELAKDSVECIVANEDEGFTYNARISRLARFKSTR